MHDMSRSDARRALTRYEVVLVKGGNTSGEVFPVPDVCQADEPERKVCRFDRLEACGGRTDCVSTIVSSF